MEKFENDSESPVAVLYGIGGSFSAGTDLKDLEEKLALNEYDWSLKITRRHSTKPLICGINGFCIGAGLELALMCDLRVMEDTAILGFFNRYLGVPNIDAGTARLPNMIGLSHALDLMLTGRRVYAEEALQMGLINRLVATGTCKCI